MIRAKLRRVLFIDHTAKMGGGEIALLNLITVIDRDRIQPLVLLFSDGPLCERLAEIGVQAIVYPLARAIVDARKDSLGGGTLLKIREGFRAAAFVWRLRSVIRKLKPDLVHTNSLKSDILGGIAGRLAFSPVVWHIRDRIEDDYLPPRVVRVFRILARLIPTAIIANSRATLETLGSAGDGNRSRVGRRPAWIVHDGTILLPAPAPPSARSSNAVVGIIGRLTPWKGQHIFIEAAAQVRRQFPLARFRIIGSALFGEDGYERELRDQVNALNLRDVVQFAGFRADLIGEISELDLLVHASTTGEPFGQVIIEGMAAGRAVVATRGGGVPEIVVDGETGLLVPMGDVTALADAIEKLLRDTRLRASMERSARKRVQDYFSIENTAQNMQNTFEAILHR